MRTLVNFDFVVCGSGSSGSVIAGRIAENRDVEVLLIEAGGNDCSASVTEAANWMANIGSERDWCFSAEPNPRLNGRRLHLAMGKGLGGGSSMNGMMWARGHRSDWDLLAVATGDSGWSYNSILKIYRRIEDWHGAPDRERRGMGGPVFVQAVPNPPLIALAFKDAAKSCGIPCYADANGEMMELERGCALLNVTVRGSRRVSIFRSYTGDVADKPNLTVLHDATVTRLLCRGKRVTGVEFSCDGETYTANAGLQVVVSLGAINTPKLLMQSGIGPDEATQNPHSPAPPRRRPEFPRPFQRRRQSVGGQRAIAVRRQWRRRYCILERRYQGRRSEFPTHSGADSLRQR
jgi:choline dehydrogenase